MVSDRQSILVDYSYADPFQRQLTHNRQVRSELIQSLSRVHDIVAALLENGHLSEVEQQSINSQPTLTDRAHLLLHTLVNKPPQAYQCFLDALLSTDQTYLYCLLTNTGAVWLKFKKTFINWDSVTVFDIQTTLALQSGRVLTEERRIKIFQNISNI